MAVKAAVAAPGKHRRVVSWQPDPADNRWRIYRLECGHFVRRWGRNERTKARCDHGPCGGGKVPTDEQMCALGRLGRSQLGRDMIRNHGPAIVSLMMGSQA